LKNLRQKTVSGLKWNYLATIVNFFAQIGYTAVMARLLDPKAFGMVALAGVILRFGVYFSQIGVGQAIIQKEKLSNLEIRSAFTVSVFLGLIFIVFVWALSPFIRFLYDQPILVPIVRFLAVSLLINNLAATAVSLLRREMRFKHLAVVQIVSQILSFAAVGIPAAFMGFGVWSLVFANLMHNAIICVGAYSLVRHDLRFLFEWKTYRPLFSFGSRISVISFFEFLGSSVDTLLIGRYLGPVQLGFYNRSYMLINLPIYQFSNSLSQVLFPSLSKLQDDIAKIREVFLKSLSLISFFIFPICIAVSIVAELVIRIVLGPGWEPSVIILRILALAMPFSLVSHYAGVLCDSTGKLNAKMVIQTSTFFVLGLLIYFIGKKGIVYVALIVLFVAIIRTMAFIILTSRIVIIDFRRLYNSFALPFLYSLCIATSLFTMKNIFRPETNLYVLCLSFLTIYIVISLVFIRQNDYLRNYIINNNIYNRIIRILATK